MANDLRIIERTNAPPIEASVLEWDDGTRVLTHVLPFGVVLTTILCPGGGLEVYVDGRLQLRRAGDEPDRRGPDDSPGL